MYSVFSEYSGPGAKKHTLSGAPIQPYTSCVPASSYYPPRARFSTCPRIKMKDVRC